MSDPKDLDSGLNQDLDLLDLGPAPQTLSDFVGGKQQTRRRDKHGIARSAKSKWRRRNKAKPKSKAEDDLRQTEALRSKL